MEAFIQGWGLTVAFCGLIVVVWLAAIFHLAGELRWVRTLTDHLSFELVADEAGVSKPSGGLLGEVIRDEAHAINEARDPVWALKQVRSWQIRAQRLEHALGFWTDLLMKMGLLGTVIGLGLSLSYAGQDVSKLLGPLAFKVWTTVAGLACSLLLTALFGMKLPAWVDACEKNVEAWDAKRRGRGGRPSTERS